MIRYRLNPADIYEALLCVDLRWEGRNKRFNIAALTALSIAALVLAAFGVKTRYFLIIAAAGTALLFCILYVPLIRRRKKAKALTGDYAVAVEEDGLRSGEHGEKQLFRDAKTEAFLSERVISVKMDRQIYCIPCTALRPGEKERIVETLSRVCSIYQVKTERSAGCEPCNKRKNCGSITQ